MSDQEIADLIQEYAEHAVTQAKNHGVILNYSEQSLFRLDLLLSRFTNNDVLPLPTPGTEADETLWEECLSYGGYLGEVMRQHLGGSWLAHDTDVVQLKIGTYLCSPPQRIWNRLTSDPHDTILSYYRGLQKLLGKHLFEPDLTRQ